MAPKSKLSLEYAPSGRSTCRECGTKIGKSDCRVKQTSTAVQHGRYWRTSTDFFHLACFGKSKRRCANLTPSAFSGREKIKPEDLKPLAVALSRWSATEVAAAAPRVAIAATAAPQHSGASADEVEAAAIKLKTMLPPSLVDRLMPFQKLGVHFAVENRGRIMLCDEMGLGKTVQAIALMLCYRAEWPLLIVTPSSMKLTWADELETWAPSLTPGEINLVASRSDAGRLDAPVTILTYGMFASKSAVAELIAQRAAAGRFKCVVLDESHYIKNREAQRSKHMAPLLKAAVRVALLSGTPALARPVELYSQVSSVRPELFGSFTKFASRFCEPRRMPWGMDYTGSSNLPELNSLLRRLMVRRLKVNVLKQLPPKRRQRIRLEPAKGSSGMKRVRSLFGRLKGSAELHSLVERFQDGGGGLASGDMKRVGRLRNDQRMLLSELFVATGEAKLEAVKQFLSTLLEGLGAGGDGSGKVLVFAHHIALLDGIEQGLVRAGVGLRVYTLKRNLRPPKGRASLA